MKFVMAFVAVCVVTWMQHDVAASPPFRQTVEVEINSASGGDASGDDSDPFASIEISESTDGELVAEGGDTADEEDDAEASEEPQEDPIVVTRPPLRQCGDSLGRAKCVKPDTYYSACWDTCRHWLCRNEALSPIDWERLNAGGPCGAYLGLTKCPNGSYFELCKSTCSYWKLLGVISC